MLRIFIICCALIAPWSAMAAQKTLSQFEYKQLSGAFKLMEEGQLTAARAHLLEAQKKVKSDYAKALVFHNLAQIALQRDQFKPAIINLKAARALNALPDKQQINILHTLGQLHCMQEEWNLCISNFRNWMTEAPQEVKPNDHLLLAQAYAQIDRWKSVIPHIKTAIKSKKVAPENWYQLLIGAHIRLKQWPLAVQQQQILIRHYSHKPSHWRQLVSLQLQSGRRKAALATQRMGFERKLLRQAKDYTLLAQLMMNHQIPFHAGKVLEEGFKHKVLKGSKKNLQLLSRAWMQSKESGRAISALKKLYRLTPTEKIAIQLAQMQLLDKSWSAAEATLLNALQKKSKQPARLQLMLGIARINMKDYESARESLEVAAGDSRYSKSVKNWIRYLDQMDAASEQRG